MATDTKIEWADKTWSPLIGCDRVSPGCDGCYAITTANIRKSNPNQVIATAFAGTTHRANGRTDWTGQINQLEDRLTQPLAWKKPRKIFVNSQSDLFHKNVDHDFIVKIFAVMAATPQHTYQVLTKRHGRMRALLSSPAFAEAVEREFLDLTVNKRPHLAQTTWAYPLPNLWLGVSVENQQWADTRIPALLHTPAAIRWISAEPLLGPIDLDGPIVPGRGRPKLTYWLTGRPGWGPEETGPTGLITQQLAVGPRLDWVVAGGESGPNARPAHLDWFRTLRDQCVAANVPYLFKQWGEWGPEWPLDADGAIVRGKRGLGIALANDGTVYQPGDLTYPGGPRYGEAVRAGHDKARLTAMYHLGKKAAGRELDGRTWDQYPDTP